MSEAAHRMQEGFVRLRAALRRCRACGYDRREHRTGRCPECGLAGDLFGERREALAWLRGAGGLIPRSIPPLAARWVGGRVARQLAHDRIARGAVWMVGAALLTFFIAMVRVEVGVTLGWGANAARVERLSGEYQRERVSLGSGRITSGGSLDARSWSGDVLYRQTRIVGVSLASPDDRRLAGLVLRLVVIAAFAKGLAALGSLLAPAEFGVTEGLVNVGRVVFAPWLTACACVTIVGELLHVLVIAGLLLWRDSYTELGPGFFIFMEVGCVLLAAAGGFLAMVYAAEATQRVNRPAVAE
ncbi:MAG: hypothetical protein IPM64_02165 [Phycisphaerales bacterium]|nr:hypothetical protein [Phycisphaerales bacterium]